MQVANDVDRRELSDSLAAADVIDALSDLFIEHEGLAGPSSAPPGSNPAALGTIDRGT